VRIIANDDGTAAPLYMVPKPNAIVGRSQPAGAANPEVTKSVLRPDIVSTPLRAAFALPVAQVSLAPFAVAACNSSFTSIRDIQSLATNVRNPPSLAEPLSIGTRMWYRDTAQDGRGVALSSCQNAGSMRTAAFSSINL
jgi:hypothetical protein